MVLRPKLDGRRHTILHCLWGQHPQTITAVPVVALVLARAFPPRPPIGGRFRLSTPRVPLPELCHLDLLKYMNLKSNPRGQRKPMLGFGHRRVV